MHAQGGKLQIGAPTGNWLMVVVYRGKHDPVSRPRALNPKALKKQ